MIEIFFAYRLNIKRTGTPAPVPSINEYKSIKILSYKPLHHSASIEQEHQLITPRATRIAYFSGFTSILSASTNGLPIALLI